LPTLSEIKAGEKILKGVPNYNFWNKVIFSLKSKGGAKGKIFNLQL
jgi:hypothetical protein